MNYGSGRVWHVSWEGESADDARKSLVDSGVGAAFRCGPTHAVWHVDWAELKDGRFVATLIPANPHAISPAAVVVELPIPSEAT